MATYNAIMKPNFVIFVHLYLRSTIRNIFL